MTVAAAPDLATARVGMVGGGQLARMTQRAAIDLGVHLEVLARQSDDPAVLIGAPHRIGDPDALPALRALAADVDVVTLDHELVPNDHLTTLAADGHVLHPTPDAVRLAQDKLHQRRTLGPKGFPVPAVAPTPHVDAAVEFAATHGWPIVLKARRGGYDGRGVAVVGDESEAREVLAGAAAVGSEWYAEAMVPIEREVAYLAARRPSGDQVDYPLIETVQREGILVELLMPAPVEPTLADEARELGRQLVSDIDATGIVAVELFVTTSGDLVVNELALRPHNSGHATIEATSTSQFHNHLRAVLDWPLGDTSMRAPAAALVNLLGGEPPSQLGSRMADALAVPNAHVHLYGKEPRPARKVGHVTALADDLDEAIHRARTAAERLMG